MIFTERFALFPNRLDNIMNSIESNEDIKDKMYRGLLYGELIHDHKMTRERALRIFLLNAVIRIVGVKEFYGQVLEVSFLFTNTELGAKYQELYCREDKLFQLHPRAIVEDGEYKFITFDLHEII